MRRPRTELLAPFLSFTSFRGDHCDGRRILAGCPIQNQSQHPCPTEPRRPPGPRYRGSRQFHIVCNPTKHRLAVGPGHKFTQSDPAAANGIVASFANCVRHPRRQAAQKLIPAICSVHVYVLARGRRREGRDRPSHERVNRTKLRRRPRNKRVNSGRNARNTFPIVAPCSLKPPKRFKFRVGRPNPRQC